MIRSSAPPRCGLLLSLVVCLLLSGCQKPAVPSYSVRETGDKVSITLYTTAGEIPVEIEKRKSGRGSGTRNGTRSNGAVSFEVKYEQEGEVTTLTSVTVNGQEIPKNN